MEAIVQYTSSVSNKILVTLVDGQGYVFARMAFDTMADAQAYVERHS